MSVACHDVRRFPCRVQQRRREGGGDTYVPRNSNQWFTEAELAEKGLSTLPAPTGLSGDMSSDLNWYNDGYSFNQACSDCNTFLWTHF